jgi:CIC family chloride channel protein
LTPAQLFLILSLLIGISSGLAVVCFRISIESVRWTIFGSSLAPSFPIVVLAPALTGLAVGVIATALVPSVRGSGVNHTKAAVYVYDGVIPFKTVVAKFASCALSLGGGHSLGPEDPSLQIGAGLASTVGRRLELSRQHLRLIAPVGAAAGLAAAFNSPITAVLFVIEEVIGTWSAVALGAVVLAAVSSVVVQQLFLGDRPLFHIPEYHLTHSSELLSYAVLGIVGGLAAVAFVKLVLPLRGRLRKLPRWTWYFQPAVAGAAIGVIGIWFPQVLGVGYEFIDQAIHDEFLWPILLALAGLKILTTAASFASGAPGGLFAPTLFIGAMLGAGLAALERTFLPASVGPTGAYALVGMATLLAGILRAPITSVFMIVEVSGNYSIVLPVMIASTLSYLISRQLQPAAIFDVLGHQDGIVLPSMEEQRETRRFRVEDAMRPRPHVLFRSQMRIVDARDQARGADDGAFLVHREADGWGLLTRQDLERAAGAEETVATLVPAAVPYVYPDQPLETALRLIQGRPVLPVVHRADPRQLVGVISLNDIVTTTQGTTT